MTKTALQSCCEWSHPCVLSGTRLQQSNWPTSKLGVVGFFLRHQSYQNNQNENQCPKSDTSIEWFENIDGRLVCQSFFPGLWALVLPGSEQSNLTFPHVIWVIRGWCIMPPYDDSVRTSSSERPPDNPFPARSLQFLCFGGQVSFHALQFLNVSCGLFVERGFQQWPSKTSSFAQRGAESSTYPNLPLQSWCRFISAQASLGTTTLNGKLPFRRLGHCPVTLGENTAPTWHLLLKFLVLRQGNSGSKIRSSSLAWLNICSGPGCAIEEEIGAKSIGWFRFGPYHHWISTGTFWTPQLMPTFPLRNRSDNRKSNSMYIYIYLYK